MHRSSYYIYLLANFIALIFFVNLSGTKLTQKALILFRWRPRFVINIFFGKTLHKFGFSLPEREKEMETKLLNKSFISLNDVKGQQKLIKTDIFIEEA